MKIFLFAFFILGIISCDQNLNLGDSTPPSVEIILTYDGETYSASSEGNASIEVALPRDNYSFQVIATDEDGASKAQIQSIPNFGFFESNNDFIAFTNGNTINREPTVIHEDVFQLDPNFSGSEILIGGAATNFGNFEDIQNGNQSRTANIRIVFQDI